MPVQQALIEGMGQFPVAGIAFWSDDWMNPRYVPVFHLHGDRDRLIPIEGVRPTEVLRGAGHLFPITHPAEVASFVRRIASPPHGTC
jgi:pimeloyl-ACP methyl ester carboxylesterase